MLRNHTQPFVGQPFEYCWRHSAFTAAINPECTNMLDALN